MMAIAAGMGPGQEIYSIDECFIDLAGLKGDLTERGRALRQRILQWTGLPTCIGIAPSKTLAKLANHIAKTAERKPGSYPAQHTQVCNIGALPLRQRLDLLASTRVGDIWGIGPRLSQQLQAAGVLSALDLCRLDTGLARRRWSINLERTIRELQGQACHSLQTQPAPKQQIACTRSFGAPITDQTALAQAVSEFAARACEKLRRQSSVAGQVHVFTHTSPFRAGPRHSKAVTVALHPPSADTLAIAVAAMKAVPMIFKAGVALARAGVILMDLEPAEQRQGELDEGPRLRDSARLMQAVDNINQRLGQGAIRVASAGAQRQRREWEMRQELRTPRYTSCWAELPQARA